MSEKLQLNLWYPHDDVSMLKHTACYLYLVWISLIAISDSILINGASTRTVLMIKLF